MKRILFLDAPSRQWQLVNFLHLLQGDLTFNEFHNGGTVEQIKTLTSCHVVIREFKKPITTTATEPKQ